MQEKPPQPRLRVHSLHSAVPAFFTLGGRELFIEAFAIWNETGQNEPTERGANSLMDIFEEVLMKHTRSQVLEARK